MRLFQRYKLTTKIALRDRRLTGGSVLKTHAALVDLYNPHTGYAWPSIAKLAEITGYSTRQIQRAIKRLIELGYLIVRRGGGRGRANEYIPTEPPEEPSEERVTSVPPHQHLRSYHKIPTQPMSAHLQRKENAWLELVSKVRQRLLCTDEQAWLVIGQMQITDPITALACFSRNGPTL